MKTSINTLHHQDIDWLRELDFYAGELNILTKRLEEIIVANTHLQVTSEVEHFQNKFIVLKEAIDTLRHEINGRESNVEKAAIAKPTHITEHSITGNTDLYNKMKSLAADVADTRFELNQFLFKAM